MKNILVAKIISNIYKFLTIRHLLHKSISFHKVHSITYLYITCIYLFMAKVICYNYDILQHSNLAFCNQL